MLSESVTELLKSMQTK